MRRTTRKRRAVWPNGRRRGLAVVKRARPSPCDQELIHVKRFAHRRYHSRPNVLAVGIGTKFKRTTPAPASSRRVEGVTCLQFFVTRKQRAIRPRHRLPRFVYARLRDGRVDHRRRIPTDVIPVGRIHAACGAGSPLDAAADHGLITLIFRNKAEPGRHCYLLSCAHVAGDIHRSPPAYGELTSDPSLAGPFARTIVNATARGDEMVYDIALARIDGRALPLPELRVRGEAVRLRSFLPRRLLQPGLGVSAALRNRSVRGAIDSLEASARVAYGRQTILVHHLFGLNVAAGKGDSGGLIYRDTAAVGIVVAASPEGWLWFQPLESAVAFLATLSPVPITVFNPKPTGT
jgi:hypothetical protein